jgi:hypothetical protein
MSVVFPNSNLPTSSQPWGREVTKQLTNIIASTTTAQINNAARDNQLNSSIIALTSVVGEVKIASAAAQEAADSAQDAIDGLTGLGSAGSSYSIYADNISGGTITGVTITGVTLRTQSSGPRIELTGSRQNFYGQGGTLSGFIEMDTAGSVNINNGTQAMYIASGVCGLISGSSQLEVTSGMGTSVFGRFNATEAVYMNGLNAASTNIANMRRNQGSDGQVVVTNQSSIRFKKDIVDLISLEDLNPKKLLQLPVRAFKYKDEYPISPDDSRYQKFIPGFIAEEMEEFYSIGADYEDGKNGIVESWNERILVPAMLALIQELYQRIETLENGA